MATVDIATFIADLKYQAVEHGFHIHDERLFVETYSMRQAWEVDVHPDDSCGGPLDVHFALEVDPRTMLMFEDHVMTLPNGVEPTEQFELPLIVTWSLPPMPEGPDLLVLATDLAGIGGADLPLDVSAVDAYASVTDAPERSLTITAKLTVSVNRMYLDQVNLGHVLSKVADISRFLLDRAPAWLEEG